MKLKKPVIKSFSDDTGVSQADRITSDSTLKLKGIADKKAKITIFDNGKKIGLVTADAKGNWTFTTKALGDGAHKFTASATLATSKSPVSSPMTVTVDKVAPGAPSITAMTDDTGISATDHITNDDSLVLSGTAAAGAIVKVFDGVTLVGTTVAAGDGAWSLAATGLGDGAHSFTAKASDVAGNQSGASSTFAVTVDKTAPGAATISAVSDDTGSSASDHVTSDDTVVVSGTAEAGATVEVFEGEVLLGTAVADGNGQWTIQLDSLPDGNHTLTARATDAAGNQGADSSDFVVTIDTAAPDAPAIDGFTLDSGTDGDNITNDSTPTISGRAEAGATISIYEGATLLGSATADGNGDWSVTVSSLADGAHSLVAKATDSAGNQGSASTPLSITVDTVAPAAPVISGFGTDNGTPGDHITSDNTLSFTGTAVPGTKVELFDGATSLGTVPVDGSGNWTYPATDPLADGVHSFTAKAIDTAGNASAASSTFQVVIETSPPAAPTITGFGDDSGASQTDHITSDTTPTLSGSAVAGGTVKVYDGVTLLGSTTAGLDGTWSFTTAALGQGNHSFTATVTSAAGTTSAASNPLAAVIDTDTITPVITTADGVSFDATPAIDGTGEAGATVTLYEGATVAGSAAIDGSGNWTVQIGSALSFGLHQLTAKVTDDAGNVSSVSDGLLLFIDDGSNPANTLTAGADTVNAGVGNLTLHGTAFTLNDVDNLDGGDGYDILALSGPGLFDLTPLAGFANFEKVTLSNTIGGHAELFLTNSGTDLMEVAASGSDFNVVLGGGQVSVDFTNATGSKVTIGNGLLNGIECAFVANAAGSTFQLQDGEFNFTNAISTLTGSWAVDMTAGGTLIVDSSKTSHLSAVTGDNSNVLTTLDTTLDLTDTVVSGGVTIGTLNDEGTIFQVDSLEEALVVTGNIGGDTLEALTLTLSTGQKNAIFAAGIETIHDATGIYI